jgi:hypothetical protein
MSTAIFFFFGSLPVQIRLLRDVQGRQPVGPFRPRQSLQFCSESILFRREHGGNNREAGE